ncbi:MAG: hypothetical protein ACOCM4_11720, partial [Acetivibrio ethanolgignens]
EPEEVLQRTEDWILGKQETTEIDNYTMAVTFARKVYQSPKKTWTPKKILMIAVSIVAVIGGISIALFLHHRNIQTRERKLTETMKDGENYLQNDNYQRAVEEYSEAKKLAGSLKKDKEALQADQYKKLSEQIILADEALIAGEYEKAQQLYITARKMSQEAGNVGKNYIDSQLDRAKNYMAVYDLIALGEKKEEYGNLESAIAAYKEAREKAADIYDREGKAEALEKQAAAEEELEKAQLEEKAKKKEQEEAVAAEAAKQKQEEEAALELENQQKANDQKNAIDLENQGNMLLAEGQYESAITFYQAAQAIYRRLELDELADNLKPKIDAAKAGMNAAAEEKQ